MTVSEDWIHLRIIHRQISNVQCSLVFYTEGKKKILIQISILFLMLDNVTSILQLNKAFSSYAISLVLVESIISNTVEFNNVFNLETENQKSF